MIINKVHEICFVAYVICKEVHEIILTVQIMSEIMDFVSYHLKQVGLDNRMLNGGVILTGGGSQLKHLIQLTEYVTGLNARIGYPNEHLAAGHIEELAKPMYSTCLGLILKGYNDFENKRKQFETQFAKIEVPESLQQQPPEDRMEIGRPTRPPGV